MMSKRNWTIISVALLLLPTGLAFGQDQGTVSPEMLVTLNEGILQYLEGSDDTSSLTSAIDQFTSVLERETENTTALLFRALSHGRLGLVERRSKGEQQGLAGIYQEMGEYRTDPEREERARQIIEEMERILASDSISEAEKRVAGSKRSIYRERLGYVDETRENSDDELAVLRNEALQQAHVHARRKREHYRAMLADVRRLTAALERPDAVLRLLDVVAKSKVARLDEEEAHAVDTKEIPPGEAGGPPDALREASTQHLQEAAGILEALLTEELDRETLTRTRFFLGVIRYRQGVPLGAQRLDAHNQEMLRKAEQNMSDLVLDEETDTRWRSYAALYMGMVLPLRARTEANMAERNELLDRAEHSLIQATELDAQISDGVSNIPALVWRQRDRIAKQRELAAGAPRPRNDIRVYVYGGAVHDSNVLLLGERTDLPRNLSRKKDFGLTAGGSVDYTWDITGRLTFGCQGRLAELWNVDVHDFDQQTYGATLALQYEAFPEQDRVGPVYLALQYDFDFTLLGRAAFLESYAIAPNVRAYWAGRRARTDVFATYEIRDYTEPVFDRRFNRDGEYGRIGVLQRFEPIDMTATYERWGLEPWGLVNDDSLEQDDPTHPRRNLAPYVGARYEWDATAGDEFDRKAGILSLGVELPLPWGLLLDASAEWTWEDYSKNSLTDFHRRRRRDFIQDYGVTVSRTFVLQPGVPEKRYTPAFDRVLMTVRAFANWTLDDSNVVDRSGQSIFEYDRTVYGINFAFTFN